MVKALFAGVLLVSVALGQSYNFSIPEFRCVVEVNTDRSLDISYEILFQCTPGYSSIDIVDIGFPSDNYQLSSIEAGVDGAVATDIRYSTYIDKGVEVHLGGSSIYSGEQGHFWLTGTNENMVFLDTEDDDYASVEFTPTWFDSDLLSGYSDFTLVMVFPEGSTTDNVRYHDRPFTDFSVEKDGRVSYIWEETRRVDSPYMVGISFPDDLVDGPLSERPKEPLISEDTLFVLAGFGLFFLFVGSLVFAVARAVIKAKRRRSEYLPPKLGLEGSGIKRGLTAPLAALLLEQKLDRVFVLIIFGLLKKGILKLNEEGRLIKTGTQAGLRSYEEELLAVLPDDPAGKPVPGKKLKQIFVNMIEVLEKKMDGFSLKESQEYYRRVIESAWKLVADDKSSERAEEVFGSWFHWLLADEEFDSRLQKIPSGDSIIMPAYMYNMFPAGKISGGSSGGMSLSQACSQVAGALTRTAQNTVSSLTGLSSAVTSKTNPVPVSTYRSSGGGSSCACACAGCACACAGGGR
ncbi:hypothetical protein DRQ21_07980 [Candidatus Fermentibacteria bacterium]|nr:MAG: hypothetical protein DRQ21_07980 [Candidatus Fermentibacteria bacterium]